LDVFLTEDLGEPALFGSLGGDFFFDLGFSSWSNCDLGKTFLVDFDPTVD
jgi:hypothetical protein